MPPLDWSIIQSVLTTLLLPCCAATLGVLAVVFFFTKTETLRSTGASIALIAGLAAGNFRAELVPFLAVHSVANNQGSDEDASRHNSRFPVEFDTGWYSLFSVTVIAVLSEVLVNCWLRNRPRVKGALVVSGLVAVILATWLTPWVMLSVKPWIGGLLALTILLNAVGLRFASQMTYGPYIPLVVAVIWGGSATAMAVLAHSARFADLAMLMSCSVGTIGLFNCFARQHDLSIYSVPAVFVPGLMLSAITDTYSEIPSACFVIVGIAPAVLVLLGWSRLRNWFTSRPIALMIFVLIPLSLAVGLAIRADF